MEQRRMYDKNNKRSDIAWGLVGFGCMFIIIFWCVWSAA